VVRFQDFFVQFVAGFAGVVRGWWIPDFALVGIDIFIVLYLSDDFLRCLYFIGQGCRFVGISFFVFLPHE
jgi:hypothetical protein